MQQLEPNLLKTTQEIASYRDFSNTALPERVLLVNNSMLAPINSVRKSVGVDPSSKLKESMGKFYNKVAPVRVKYIDIKKAGAFSIIQDYHLKAICNSIIENRAIIANVPEGVRREEFKSNLFKVLESRFSISKKRVGGIMIGLALLDVGIFFLTPPGTEMAIGGFLIGHEIEIFNKLKQALQHKSWSDKNILVEEDSRLTQVEDYLATGKFDLALQFIDDCDGILDNQLYAPELVPLAESLLLRR